MPDIQDRINREINEKIDETLDEAGVDPDEPRAMSARELHELARHISQMTSKVVLDQVEEIMTNYKSAIMDIVMADFADEFKRFDDVEELKPEVAKLKTRLEKVIIYLDNHHQVLLTAGMLSE